MPKPKARSRTAPSRISTTCRTTPERRVVRLQRPSLSAALDRGSIAAQAAAFLLIALCSLPHSALATDAESNASTEEGDDESHPEPGYFQRHAEGWFWYHDPVVATKTTPSK